MTESIRRRDAALAHAILSDLGCPANSIRQIVGRGEVNHVFVADERLVVRFPIDELRADEFEVEEFGMKQAALVGVPVPEFIARGRIDGIPYIVQSFIEGICGADRPTLDLWSTLGDFARRIHSIPLDANAPDGLFPRFGRDLQRNWELHVDYNLGELTPSDRLISQGVYKPQHQAAIRETFERLKGPAITFGFKHGDVVPKNCILPPAGPPVLIDWGSATASPAPHDDLIRLINDYREFGTPTWPEIEAFADGCQADLIGLLPVLDDMILLGRIDLCRWAIDRRPDLFEEIAAKAQKAVQEANPTVSL